MTPSEAKPAPDPLTGTHRRKALAQLREAGVRPTHQRVQLLALLIHGGNRYVTADDVSRETKVAGIKVTLATIYNILHEFTRVGILREVGIDGSRVYFDTNLAPHFHLYFEDSRSIHAIPVDLVSINRAAGGLDGIDPQRLDVVIRVAKSRQ